MKSILDQLRCSNPLECEFNVRSRFVSAQVLVGVAEVGGVEGPQGHDQDRRSKNLSFWTFGEKQPVVICVHLGAIGGPRGQGDFP